MKKTVLFSIAVMALMISSCGNTAKTSDPKMGSDIQVDTTKLAKGAVFYQCEMNPEVLSDKPGTCSKCGMELEKMEKK